MDSRLWDRSSLRFEIGALCFLFMAAVTVGWFHVFFIVDLSEVGQRVELHSQIISGVAESPYRYRVLSPFLGEALTRVAGTFESDSVTALLWGFRVLNVMAVALSLAASFYYFREFFSRAIALAGALLIGALMVIPLRDHYYQPWSLLEVGFVALGLLLIKRRELKWFLLVVLLASLNREASVVLVVAAAAGSYINARMDGLDERERFRDAAVWTISALTVWLAVFFALRGLLGSAPPVEPISELWLKNTQASVLPKTVAELVAFLGPLWVLAPMGWGAAPSFVKWTASMVPVNLGLFMVFGIWSETRVLMPIYPVVVPLCFSYMLSDHRKPETGGRLDGRGNGART